MSPVKTQSATFHASLFRDRIRTACLYCYVWSGIRGR